MTTITVGGTRVSARVADSLWSQTRGFRGRIAKPGYALVFPFDDTDARTLDMLGVNFDVDAAFVVDEEVQTVQRLAAWTGVARDPADTIIEVPVGVCDVAPGMEVTL